MISLYPSVQNYSEQAIVLIGRGLVGSAIESALYRRRSKAVEECITNWQDPRHNQLQLLNIVENCINSNKKKIDIIWSAGKAGFGSTKEQTDEEYLVFDELMTEAVNALSKTKVKTTIHLISSAGALFEGQSFVNSRSTPNCRRPYCSLKLKQETLVQSIYNPLISIKIYRPSSVFGYANPGKRFGLISSMIYNSIKRRETSIFSNYYTIRDYIWADDLADFVAENILYPGSSTNIIYLVSCRPMSIFQVHKTIEKSLNLPCAIKFVNSCNNAANNTYSPEVLPLGLKTTSLITAISKIYHQALQAGYSWK
jgi:nucleoside-diphosphate-sugar epimerase